MQINYKYISLRTVQACFKFLFGLELIFDTMVLNRRQIHFYYHYWYRNLVRLLMKHTASIGKLVTVSSESNDADAQAPVDCYGKYFAHFTFWQLIFK